jgi:hypothetical protein
VKQLKLPSNQHTMPLPISSQIIIWWRPRLKPIKEMFLQFGSTSKEQMASSSVILPAGSKEICLHSLVRIPLLSGIFDSPLWKVIASKLPTGTKSLQRINIRKHYLEHYVSIKRKY